MKVVSEMLKPKANVFVDTTREDVIDLTDLVEHKINAEDFFSQNFQTEGMKVLLDTAFQRFCGESNTGVIKLTQAMGGGKTHNMVALGLLAENKEMRTKIFGNKYEKAGDISVVAFSGRETPEFGIWGAIAEQLGKREFFKDYYMPLSAPGESAWINLLKGQKVLILLDELPPYLENAKSKTVGNSDLSKVTITALSNLFVAIGKQQLSNVCLVFSDLNAAYESGSDLLRSSFRELEQEANRVALEITPVNTQGDEIFNILRKRLFEDISPESNFSYFECQNEIAMAFKSSVEFSKKAGYTSYKPEAVFRGISSSYPFHPSIRDIYARFKENQGFQQTRGMIRLMRQIVRYFFESGEADKKYLINVFDLNLNNDKMFSLIRQIKPSLDEAITHDIAQAGKSIAELIDEENSSSNSVAQQTAKLILMSSLSTVAHGQLGLTEQEIFGFLSEPEREINEVKIALEALRTQAWYIKSDNRGRIYFQNTKNMIAEMNTLVDSYTNENARNELRKILEESFKPKLKNCYEIVQVLPAIDEIKLDTNKITLVIFEPYPGNGLHPDLVEFYKNISETNRVMFLSGQRDLMEKLYINSKKLKAIQEIVRGMKDEGISASDQQYKEAEAQSAKALQALYSTIRETFVILYFPTRIGIESAELKFEFKNNEFNGEEQIIACLRDNQKYEDFTNDDQKLETLRKKCEKRIFTTQSMTYSQIKDRAASTPEWQWLHPNQMDVLKKYCLTVDKWREVEGYLVQGPFKKDPTSVKVEQIGYDEKTYQFTLRVKGIGGTVYYDVGAAPTTASTELKDQNFSTNEPSLNFVCIDNTNDRETGEIETFIGKPITKYGERNSGNGVFISFVTHPKYTIKYTTDGSEPKENGGIYNTEFRLPDESRFVRYAVMYGDYVIEEKSFSVDTTQKEKKINIDPKKQVTLKFGKSKSFDDTASSYKELSDLERLDNVSIKGSSVYMEDKNNRDLYIELTSGIPCLAGNLKKIIDNIRTINFADNSDVTVTLSYDELVFTSGKLFLQWIDLNKYDINTLARNGEIIQ